ncbi:RNA-binding protein [Hanstruepera neustonica]|uniref:RNA-binding protein n=1 Tax=Hanstruepera neustonica TaxID=1445657 RepID=A0A2K1E3Q3_9FLAO|nr:FG-GAP-like repeat-containing protein [Hanstruepera neustonica]PNQ74851.1 RNA-binding protein [Hanstruepera neustonica]
MKTKLLFSIIICLATFQMHAQPGNDTLAGAIPITPSPEGTGCATPTFNLPFSTDGTTDSNLQGNCSASGLDQFFSWTATSLGLSFSSQAPGNPGIVIWNTDGTVAYDCATTFSNETLSGWNLGDDLIIQIYDFEGTALSDVAFCLSINNIAPPQPSPITFSTQNFTSLGINQINWAVVDMNGDFLDDIVTVGSYSTSSINVQFQNSGGGFTSVDIDTPDADFAPSWSIGAGDYDRNGYTDLLYGNGSGVTFMKAEVNVGNLNNGNPFDDVTSFIESSGSEYVFSQRSNFADINNDGHLDAFVCHDVAPNVYYINDGAGNLTFNQGGLGDYASGGNYGSIWIDYDNDGDLDMFIAKCGGETERRKNQMLRNNGDGSYTEVAASLGLDDPMQTWSSAWGDFDNDGDMDVFVGASTGTHKFMRNDVNTTGVFTDVTVSSNVTDLSTTGHENLAYDFDNDGNLDIASNGNILFGNGDLTFYTIENPFPYVNGSFGDLNDDGFIDVVTQSNGVGTVHFNGGTSHNWIKIHTVGTTSNINGIGARVEVYTSSGMQIRDVKSGSGFAFMSSLNTHVGLGSETSIIKIIVRWPSGFIDQIDNPAINQSLTIVEGDHSLSVEDLTLSNLVIYPNPVRDNLYFKTNQDLSPKIATIFDLNGKRILNGRIENNTIDVSSLQSGIYLLRIESNGQLITRKLIKL